MIDCSIHPSDSINLFPSIGFLTDSKSLPPSSLTHYSNIHCICNAVAHRSTEHIDIWVKIFERNCQNYIDWKTVVPLNHHNLILLNGVMVLQNQVIGDSANGLLPSRCRVTSWKMNDLSSVWPLLRNCNVKLTICIFWLKLFSVKKSSWQFLHLFYLGPSPRTLVLSLERPGGSSGKSTVGSPRRSLSTPQRVTPIRHNPVVVALKRGVRRAQASASAARRELRAVRRRALYQQKQLQEATSKLEQHERRLDEAERHIDCLMKELIARGWAQSGNISPSALESYAHLKQSPVTPLRHSRKIIKHKRHSNTSSDDVNDSKFSPGLTAVENYKSDSEDSESCEELKRSHPKGGPDAPHCVNKSKKHELCEPICESSPPAETFQVESSDVVTIPTSVPC